MTAFMQRFLNNLDRSSQEFFEIYSLVNMKYWGFSPKQLEKDQPLRARKMLNDLANMDVEDWVPQLTATISNQVFELVKDGKPGHIKFGVGGKEFYVDFYDDKEKMAGLHSKLGEVADQIQKQESKIVLTDEKAQDLQT